MERVRAARVVAQAKINLFLRVQEGLRPDGYHDVFTEFQRLELADEVVVRVGQGGRALHVSGAHLPAAGLGAPEQNLAYRAAMEYAARTGWTFPTSFEIRITKHVPVGGGLGGGSADAAAVLRALDALAPTPMDPDELRQVAASLGADVPYLTTERVRACGVGRGDVVTPAPGFAEPLPADVVLLVPPFGIATADAYRWLDESRPGSGPARQAPWPPAAALERVGGTWDGYCRVGNDFEAVVEQRFPLLRELRERLLAGGAVAARLSGSGSTVFGIFEDGQRAAGDFGGDALAIRTRTATRVVPVEVLE